MTKTASFPSQVRSIEDLTGPAGRLEALLNTGHRDAPYAALVCHPHPPSGGTMHNKVVYHAMKTFASLGLPVLRFNFRGTGSSAGTYDEGNGEQDDVRAALDWIEFNLKLPVLFAGFSFGSYVGLRACCGDDRVKALVALGMPVLAAGRDYTYEFLRDCRQPKLFITGDHDQFSPHDATERLFGEVAEPKRLVWISGAEHFFQGVPASTTPKLTMMQAALHSWLTEHFPLSQRGL